MARGRGVFAAQCEKCHAVPGGRAYPDQGALAGYPNLPGDTLVMGRDPTTVLRIILQGGTPPPVPGETVRPMPTFGQTG